jgi:prepilin-type N-terminal cleavage/methylation domain-containing protein
MPDLNPRHPSAGFTLIELLVVIAIIGVLMQLLVEAQQASQAASAVSAEADERTLREIGAASGDCLAAAAATLGPLHTELATAHATRGALDPDSLRHHQGELTRHRECLQTNLEALREIYRRLDRRDRSLAGNLRRPLQGLAVELDRAGRLLEALLVEHPPEPVVPPEPV